MQGRKTFKYRIYASSQTINRAEGWLSLCRELYNSALQHRIASHKQNKKAVSLYEQTRELLGIKAILPEFKDVSAQTLEDVLIRLDLAFKGFFRRVKTGEKPGFPRFKGINRYDSFTLRQSGWRLNGKHLDIKNVGRFKVKFSRPIEGNIKTVTIRRSPANKWYASFSCEDVSYKPLPPSDRIVGIDVGCESFLTTSEGTKIDNPRFFKEEQDGLAKRQQRVSRRKKGSHRWEKAKLLVSKSHEKIVNQRRDFHYKVARLLVNYYGTICIEEMNAWNSNRALNRSMRDVAWFSFFIKLRWKAGEAARTVIEVPPKYTSQKCSQCGNLVPKDLSVRIHDCPNCSLKIDRDVNAALNILRAGQALQEARPCTLS